jgi:hypothetical protein
MLAQGRNFVMRYLLIGVGVFIGSLSWQVLQHLGLRQLVKKSMWLAIPLLNMNRGM